MAFWPKQVFKLPTTKKSPPAQQQGFGLTDPPMMAGFGATATKVTRMTITVSYNSAVVSTLEIDHVEPTSGAAFLFTPSKPNTSRQRNTYSSAKAHGVSEVETWVFDQGKDGVLVLKGLGGGRKSGGGASFGSTGDWKRNAGKRTLTWACKFS